jgi:hypothetical protein
MGWMTEELGFDFYKREGDFSLFSTAFRLALRSIQHPTRWVGLALTPEVKQLSVK